MPALPQAVPFGICSRSVGRSAAGRASLRFLLATEYSADISDGADNILDILDECAKAGLWTIEVAYECLEVRNSTSRPPSSTDLTLQLLASQNYAKSLTSFSNPRDALREAARRVNQRAQSLGLVCAVLDAFEGYEGLLDREQHDRLVDDFKFWVELCGIMGIEMVQVPASFETSEKATDDVDVLVADLRELADIGLSVSPPIKVRLPLCGPRHVAGLTFPPIVAPRRWPTNL